MFVGILLLLVLCACAGDHVLIAKETARMLGMNTNIKDSKGLPSMGSDGKVPKDLAKNFGQMIMEADGFAQAGACTRAHTHACIYVCMHIRHLAHNVDKYEL
jgi:hypothetical protein